MKASVSQLGYLGLNVADLDAWVEFATRVLGLEEIGGADDGARLLKMDHHHHRVALHPHGGNDVAYVGWQVADLDSLQEIARRLEQRHAEVVWGSRQEARDRRVAALFRTNDPSGVRIEVFFGPEMQNERPFRSPRGVSGFEAGALGLGHVVLCVDDYEATRAFYAGGLGLKTTDFIDISLGEDGQVTAAFLHAGPRHHSLAFMELAAPRRLHHFMLQVTDEDDVGRTYDLCQERKIPIARSLGRHTNDQMLSFYMQSPSGFEVEYGYGGILVDDATWQVQRHVAPSVWGHRPMS